MEIICRSIDFPRGSEFTLASGGPQNGGKITGMDILEFRGINEPAGWLVARVWDSPYLIKLINYLSNWINHQINSTNHSINLINNVIKHLSNLLNHLIKLVNYLFNLINHLINLSNHLINS